MPSTNCQGCLKLRPIFSRSGFCHACYAAAVTAGHVIGEMPAHCSVKDCEGWAAKKGMCDRHYRRVVDHGHADKIRREGQHPEYRNWWWLKAHGKLCEAWHIFDVFVAAIGDRPTPRHWLERPDESAPFSPDNFFWREPILAEACSFKTAEDRLAYRQAVAKETPGKYVGQSLKGYGLTTDDYDAMLRVQGGVCAGCGFPETETYWKTGRVKLLVVDHNHLTGAIRGLLCSACNKAIGFANENPERLEKLADYLRRCEGLPPRDYSIRPALAAPRERICVECGGDVEQKKRSAMFCSERCRVAWHSKPGAHSDAALLANGKICVIEGCGKPYHANGYCSAHNTRFRKYGDPLHIQPKQGKAPCSVEGCSSDSLARGLCQNHYYNQRRALRRAPTGTVQ